MFERRTRGRSAAGGVLPGFLGAEPEGEAGDLDGAGVDVDAVDVVLDDHCGNAAQERPFVVLIDMLNEVENRGCGIERFTPDYPRVIEVLVYPFPGFLVNGLEEVEGVEAEVHGAAGGVEEADLARVFDGGGGGCGRVV